ncbi:MAG: 23S rRNA (uracil(1939)-C(5))-methyltransferase RlmD [Gammaproteobacteria bacterium]
MASAPPRPTDKALAEVLVQSLSHEGRGLARVNGKTVFLDGALPGERVQFFYARQRARYDEGRVVRVLEPAPARVTPLCSHFGTCGGCTLQHLAPEPQLQHKQAMVLEQLQRIGGIQPEALLPPAAGSGWGYRRKARLAVKFVTKKNAVLVGFREKHSHFVADLGSCEVLHPSVGMRIPALRALIGALSIYDKIPQIEIAVGDTATALVLRHLAELSLSDIEKLKVFSEQHRITIFLQPGGLESIQPLWPLDPPPLYYTLEGGLNVYFHPTDFIQVNAELNRLMVIRVVELLDVQSSDQVLELFSGIGNFSLPIAKSAARLTALEGDPALVARADANAKRNGINNIQFRVADLADPQPCALEGRYDRLLMDPPRSGASAVIEALDLEAVKRLVYVSCNPAILARDAAILDHKKGLKLSCLGLIDMFPHTNHVEIVALFEHR